MGMQALEKKYIYGEASSCSAAVDYDETNSVMLYPLSGLWVIYGGAVLLSAGVAVIRMGHMKACAPHKQQTLQGRAREMTRQMSFSRLRTSRTTYEASGVYSSTTCQWLHNVICLPATQRLMPEFCIVARITPE